ncbi:MAG: hypothetical protein HY940_00615 [Gammaproteobacteria bacterium]|nr:hypothetical protein [Gammaproteobacteria bacterium]
MFKKTLLALGVLIVLGVALTAAFANWARNPYGLEPERLGPKGDEALPPIAAVPNAKNYLLYPKYDVNAYVIHFALPNEYIHESNTTSRILKSYSISASMYYPELNGKFHPDNANLPSCDGWCGGYVRAFIEPSQNDAHTINSRMLERIARDRLQDSPLYQFEDLDPMFGIDEHFQIRYPVIEEKWKGDKSSTDEYFIKMDRNGGVEYLFECKPYTPSPGCGVKFNLSSRPELVVDIMFGRHLMTDWEKIISSVNKKIASWGPVKITTVRN